MPLPAAGADKYLEAPHLKAESAVVRVAGIEVRRVEIQVQAIGTADRRRPAEPAVADVHQIAILAVIAGVAEARGGSANGGNGKRSRWIEISGNQAPANFA